MTSGDGPRGRFSSCCACNWMLAPPSDALRPRGPMPFSSCRVGGCSRDCSWEADRQCSYQPRTGPFQYPSAKVTNPETGTREDKPSGLQERWGINHQHLRAEAGQREAGSVGKAVFNSPFPCTLLELPGRLQPAAPQPGSTVLLLPSPVINFTLQCSFPLQLFKEPTRVIPKETARG